MGSYYREDDPRHSRGVWSVLNIILEKISEIELIIDEHFCELDDGHHWKIIPMGEEE